MCVGHTKKHLIRTVVLSTHSMFWLRKEKINYALLLWGLKDGNGVAQHNFLGSHAKWSPWGLKFRPKWDPGRSGSLPKKKKKKNFFFFFFLGRLIFILSPHKCKLWWHYQTIYYHCIVFLLPLNGNSMCNGWFASKLTENVVVLRYNFSLSDCHFSLIVLQGEVTSP